MRRFAPLAIVLAAAVFPSPARAAEYGSFDDPVDQPLDINGYRYPDLAQAAVSFDAASGSITFADRLFADLSAPKPSRWQASVYEFRAGPCATSGGVDYTGSITLDTYINDPASGIARIDGLSGQVDHVPFSVEGPQISVTFTHPALVNKPLKCFTASIQHYDRSSADVLASRYGTWCDCWYIASGSDSDPLGPGYTYPYHYIGAPPPADGDPGGTLKPPDDSLQLGWSDAVIFIDRFVDRSYVRSAGLVRRCYRQSDLVFACRASWRTPHYRYSGSMTVSSKTAAGEVMKIVASLTRSRRGCRGMKCSVKVRRVFAGSAL